SDAVGRDPEALVSLTRQEAPMTRWRLRVRVEPVLAPAPAEWAASSFRPEDLFHVQAIRSWRFGRAGLARMGRPLPGNPAARRRSSWPFPATRSATWPRSWPPTRAGC